MSLEKFHINSNDFGDLSVQENGTVIDFEGLPEEGAFCYAQGTTEVNSIINLYEIAQTLVTKPSSETAYNYLTGRHTLEYFSTEEYMQKVEEFNNSSYFIWGDWLNGGMFITNIYNTIAFGVNYGLYEDTEETQPDNKYYDIANIDGSSIGACPHQNINQLTEVAIMTNDLGTSGIPNFRILFNGNISGQGSAMYYTVDTASVDQAKYNEGFSTLSVAMSDPSWTSDFAVSFPTPIQFQDVPCQPFNPMMFDGIFHNATINANFSKTRYLGIRGAWDAGQSFEPEDNGGDGEPSGTGGDYPTKNDKQSFTDPTGGIDFISTGLVQMYSPTASEVMQFQNFLFGDSITDEIEKKIKRLTSNPYDYVIFLAMCSFSPTNSIQSEEMSFCGQGSGIYARKIPEELIQVGPYKLNLPLNAQDFTDYNPFTKIKIYIPYVGYQDLNPDEVIGCSLELMYNIDLMTGACVVELISKRGKRPWLAVDNEVENIYYNWQGNVYMMCPLSSTDFRGFFTSMTQFALGAGSMLTGNVVGGLGAMTTAVMSSKANVAKNVPNGANYGFISAQTPYVIIERPVRQMPSWDVYASFDGVPSNMSRKISQLSGYLEADENTVWGNSLVYEYGDTKITAFDDEIEEIKQLFESGVYINV